MQKTAKANQLIGETSPYLLQHAYNPVDWHPWTEVALQKAKKEDKPILVSIGYAACHWCHVMERESFEDEEVAAYMNAHFICIKVDREERPDVDQIYMDAVQAISGSGGWPLNMFLTPEAKPFYGGTYFPPRQVHGRPSWRTVLESVSNAFHTNREKMEAQAEKLTKYLATNEGAFYDKEILQGLKTEQEYTNADAKAVYENLEERFDNHHGGFGHAPKFPNTMNLMYLLRYHYFTGEEKALKHAVLTLDKMIGGGIYDQVGGGFARYAVDEVWLVPHFEKMLYDNALLVTTLCEAYQVTGKVLYKQTIEHTLEFISREMTSTEGGFYAALDADSEGVEGKYYVWQQAELEKLLGENATLMIEYFGVKPSGNWEEVNILNTPIHIDEFVEQKGLDKEVFKQQLEQAKQALLKEREKRIKPGLDDKQLLSWNALMCSAYVKAYEVLGKEEYKNAAIRNLEFLLLKFSNGEGGFYHTYKNGEAKYPAFLDDYALLIAAMLDVYRLNFDASLIERAADLMDYTINHFKDDAGPMFFYTNDTQNDILVRKKELYDGVMPAGNSAMAMQLLRLGVMLDNEGNKERAETMLNLVKKSVLNYSTSFGNWAGLLLHYTFPMQEIAIVGDRYIEYSREIQRYFIPNTIVMASNNIGQDDFPLLKGKGEAGETFIYICEGYSCQSPLSTVQAWKEKKGQLKGYAID